MTVLTRAVLAILGAASLAGAPAQEPESKAAAPVVVGSHGRSGLKAALLGSVSRHVVDHANCPVVVVKASAES